MVEYIHFPQNMTSRFVEDYLVSEYQRLKASYEALAGRTIAADDLANSIRLYNEQRRLMR
jgi:benzoyl-CoA reductase/2-hydroxyglutaryl-CoA dehydratase subunit BcrC/BadD/HgdB